VVLYGVDARADCLGDGGYVAGKNYLVYASEKEATDVFLGELFWYGFADVLPKGTKILMPETACKPGGETSTVREAIRQLGRGRAPAKRN
jgi:hypothetical protein